jgi:predicted MFS family arabinose efflux permease
VIGAIGLLGTAYLSEVIDSRVLSTVILQLWALPLLIALYTFTEHTSQWVYFAVVTLIVGYPYVHPIQVAWASRNSNSVRTRTVSASMYNISVQLGSIIGVSDPYIPRLMADNQLIRQISTEQTTHPFVSRLPSRPIDYNS